MSGKKGNVRYNQDDGKTLVVGSEYIALETTCATGRKSRKTLFRMVRQRDGRTIYFKSYNPNLHLFRKMNAVGINSDALSHMEHDDIIALRHYLRGDTVYASVSEAREKGTYLHFKDNGCERQVFVPLEVFKKEMPKTKPKEAHEGALVPMAL